MKYTFKGINSDRDYCTCCGKSDLKRVVWFEDNESGDLFHVGTSCAKNYKGTGYKKPSTSIVSRIEAALSRGRMDLVYSYKSWIRENRMTDWLELCNQYEKEVLL